MLMVLYRLCILGFLYIALFPQKSFPLEKALGIHPESGIPTSENDKDGKQPHRIYLFGAFLFGSGGDEIFSGLYVAPVGGGGEVGYIYDNDFLRSRLSIGGSGALLFSPYKKIDPGYDSLDKSLLQGDVYLSTLFSVWRDEEMNIKLGPGIHFYGDSWVPDSPPDQSEVIRYTWFIHTGMGLEIFWDWRIAPSHLIAFGIYLPLLTVGWRPSYALLSFEQEKLWETGEILSTLFYYPVYLFFHNFFYLDFRFDYDFFLTRSWSLKTGYHGLFQYTDEPRKRLDLKNRFHLGVVFHW